jgi:outer membrane receptor protein involved in Fe transport
LKPLEVTIFNEGYTKDEFINTALTVSGKVGTLDLVYAGGYLTRDAETVSDYTNYARGLYGTYYQCASLGSPTAKCYTPSSYWFDSSDSTNMSQELRLSSPSDWRMRFVGGLFYEDREVKANTDWHYKSVPECPDSGVSTGTCFLYLDPRAAPKFQSATLNNPGRRPSDVGFLNDFTREYTQFAAFASVDFDILENLTLTLGTRYYDIENSIVGANIGSFYCKVYGTGESGPCTGDLYGYGDETAPYGTNIDEQADNKNQTDGFKSRANLTWRITGDALVYATWSEGYRPGGFNRGTALVANDVAGLDPQYARPTSYEEDDLTNIEVGWKTTFWGGRAQFNGAIYQVTWENAQTGFFAPQLGFGNLQFFTNGPDYEVNGVEFDVVVAPLDGLTLTAAGSYNKGELTNSPQLINNIEGSPGFGQPITENCVDGNGNQVCDPNEIVPVSDVYGPKGTEMANSPELQFNVRARYEWAWGDYNPYVGAAVQYQDESYSSANVVNRFLMPSWTTWDAAVGIGRNSWNAEIYAINLTDENTSMYTTASQFIIAEVPMRPRTMGLRVSYSFGGN